MPSFQTTAIHFVLLMWEGKFQIHKKTGKILVYMF
jgi:hypothetical protein